MTRGPMVISVRFASPWRQTRRQSRRQPHRKKAERRADLLLEEAFLPGRESLKGNRGHGRAKGGDATDGLRGYHGGGIRLPRLLLEPRAPGAGRELGVKDLSRPAVGGHDPELVAACAHLDVHVKRRARHALLLRDEVDERVHRPCRRERRARCAPAVEV